MKAQGTEGRLQEMIYLRQQAGIKKYGTTLSGNPLSHRQWLVHALEESLDLSAYLLRTIEELDKLADDGK
jgi:hypothetical protein